MNVVKRHKKYVIAALSGIALLFLFMTWYKYTYSMDIATTYEVNSPNLENRLLIATQGSKFKNAITHGIVNRYKNDSVFIRVIDISDLAQINPNEFDALVVIHTWENWKPPVPVTSFIERTLDKKDKIIILTTSGEGSYKMENVDAITGESILADAPIVIEKIIKKVKPLFEPKS